MFEAEIPICISRHFKQIINSVS